MAYMLIPNVYVHSVDAFSIFCCCVFYTLFTICSVLFLCPYFSFSTLNLLSVVLPHIPLFYWQSWLIVIALAIKISHVANLYLACLPDSEFHLLGDLSWTAINNSVRSQVVMSNYGDECQLKSWLTAEGQHAADTSRSYWSPEDQKRPEPEYFSLSVCLCSWRQHSAPSSLWHWCRGWSEANPLFY